MLKYFVKSSTPSSSSGYEFKMQHSFEKRQLESKRLMTTHPNKIPIILEKYELSANSDNNIKQKFLIQKDLTIGQLIFIVRRQLKLDQTQSLYISIDAKYIPSTSSTISEIYNKYCDQDGFLYLRCSAEQTFG